MRIPFFPTYAIAFAVEALEITSNVITWPKSKIRDLIKQQLHLPRPGRLAIAERISGSSENDEHTKLSLHHGDTCKDMEDRWFATATVDELTREGHVADCVWVWRDDERARENFP